MVIWGLGAMIGETMMKFSGSRTMRVSAIGIFFRNLSKNIEVENFWSKKINDQEIKKSTIKSSVFSK